MKRNIKDTKVRYEQDEDGGDGGAGDELLEGKEDDQGIVYENKKSSIVCTGEREREKERERESDNETDRQTDK